MVEWYHWAGFLVLLVAILAVDLGVLHRDAHEVPFREAVAWTGAWVALAAGFGAVLWIWQGAPVAAEYLAGYMIEWSLSIDNVFVFVLLFGAFAVPSQYQHRVLFWGVIGAIALRLTFILVGSALLHRFDWMVFVFGGMLILTAIRLLRERADPRTIHDSRLLTLVRRILPLTDEYQGQALTANVHGQRMATPLLAVLVMIELTDLVFAIDSVPAVFSVTRNAFVAFTSNAMAILGLRALYFVLSGAIGRFRYLKLALVAIIAFVGVKMILSHWVEVPITLSLGAIAGALAVGIAASLLSSRPRVLHTGDQRSASKTSDPGNT